MTSLGVEKRLIEAVLWRRLDEPASEHCRLWETADSYVFEGRVLTVVDRSPAEVRYTVDCRREWETCIAQVMLIRGESTREIELRRDERGVWWKDGERVDGMDGLPDVDLGVTPATNTLPIRRLGLEIGASAEVDAVWVRFPELELERLPQQYTRLEERRYRYESAGGAFVADLEVDAEGLVVGYGELWERIAGQ